MTRFLLTVVVPLLLPAALYLLWAASPGHAASAPSPAAWRNWPWTWLALAGLVLAAASLVVIAQTSGSRDGTYVAPHLVNGRVVPGHFDPPASPR